MEEQWFDPRPFNCKTLQDKIELSIGLYPCDILFIHRDAENENPQVRYDEIADKVACLANHNDIPHLCVVPVRMTEAWLLFDEKAIRRAAGNPNGRMNLNIPPLRRMDTIADPKSLLFNAIKKASGHSGRRLKKLNLMTCRHRVAELIEDFAPLRVLPAFQRLENDITNQIENMQ